jgi:hypothetical protein
MVYEDFFAGWCLQATSSMLGALCILCLGAGKGKVSLKKRLVGIVLLFCASVHSSNAIIGFTSLIQDNKRNFLQYFPDNYRRELGQKGGDTVEGLQLVRTVAKNLGL